MSDPSPFWMPNYEALRNLLFDAYATTNTTPPRVMKALTGADLRIIARKKIAEITSAYSLDTERFERVYFGLFNMQDAEGRVVIADDDLGIILGYGENSMTAPRLMCDLFDHGILSPIGEKPGRGIKNRKPVQLNPPGEWHAPETRGGEA